MTSAATVSPRRQVGQLVRACHPEPSVAVTVLAGLLGVATDLGPGQLALLVPAVLSGQLVIGWSNDLLDARRDRAVGRTDKPLATGDLEAALVVRALALAAVACLLLSLLLGWRPGLVHVVLLVGSGLAYNLGLKATVWSWLPYAVAFGSLPAVVTLSAEDAGWPPVWMMLAGAALGVGAHFVNTLPDLADDERTGVRGLPHRLGARPSTVMAMIVLVLASLAELRLGRAPRVGRTGAAGRVRARGGGPGSGRRRRGRGASRLGGCAGRAGGSTRPQRAAPGSSRVPPGQGVW
jgi:4-hydroxybenzoate polyprenyltransferase